MKVLVDAVNLRSAVRAARLEKGPEFLSAVLLDGGDIDPKKIAVTRGEDLKDLFKFGPLSAAGEAGSAVAMPGGGSLTEFERLCDNAVTTYLGAARRIPFGEQVIVGYLYAREAELTAIRTIMSGRLAGLEGDIIRRRLRESYV